VPVDQYVGRFQIAVDHTVLVGVIDCSADFAEEPQRLAQGQICVTDELIERAAVNVLHDEKVTIVTSLAAVVDGNDVGVIQIRDQIDLAFEATMLASRCVRAVQQELERDGAARCVLAGLVDDALATAVQLFEYLVSVDRRRPASAVRTRCAVGAARRVGRIDFERASDIVGETIVGAQRTQFATAVPAPLDVKSEVALAIRRQRVGVKRF
ncbi:MAG: hypothetical protein V3T53_15695, partial [Phycisphaerales bacterium]